MDLALELVPPSCPQIKREKEKTLALQGLFL